MAQTIYESFGYVLPETMLSIFFVLTLLTALVGKKRSKYLPAYMALLGLVLAGIFVFRQIGVDELVFSGMYAVDPFSWFFKVIFLVTGVLIILFSLQSRELEAVSTKYPEYFSLILALTIGAFFMAGSSNLLMMYLSLELVSISSYILSGFTKENARADEASLKYVIYGAFSSGLMLYGISLIYGLTGETNLYAMNQALAVGSIPRITILLAVILMLVGLGYKISAVPFHFWTPDVYEGAPITVTAFLSVTSKAAGFAMLMRFFKIGFVDVTAVPAMAGMWAIFKGFNWTDIIAVLSVLTMTVGNLVAIWQSNMKRLLAYSSIAHAGYILMGFVTLTDQGMSAILLYFVAYLLMNLGAFYVVMLIANKYHTENVEDYRGLGYRSPYAAFALTVFLFSLTGIPPTFGFIGKFYLFSALISTNYIWLAIVGVINSVVSLYYYAKVVRYMYLVEPVEKSRVEFDFGSNLLMTLLVVPNIALMLYFTPILSWAQYSVTMFGLH
ncbi:MAG: NADH-quinone oxidoreductase subunit N [Bacteroidetes bacterium]|nr:NADH-quinone oxidoreductase subunit N [Bacteroidota bacterium]